MTGTVPEDCRLTGPETFQAWLVYLKGELMIEKVYGIISGTDPTPTAVTTTILVADAGGTNTTPTPVVTQPDPDKLREWHVRNDKALGLILKSISRSLQIEYGSATDAKVTHESLVSKFSKTNISSTAFSTFIELSDLRWDGTSSFEEFAGKFSTLNARLETFGQKLGEQFLALMFLKALPNEANWNVFRTAVLNSTDQLESITFSNVRSRAAAQVTNNASVAGSSSEIALQASQTCIVHGACSHTTEQCSNVKKFAAQQRSRRNGGGGGGGQSQGSTVSTPGTGSKPRSSGRTNRSKGKSKENAKAAEEREDSSDDDDDGGGGTVFAQHVYISDELKNTLRAYASLPERDRRLLQILLDSACSAHMTPNMHWLVPSSIRHLREQVKVHLGDDSVIHGTARGTMRFSLNSKKYIELHNVLYVPKLATTLISIPALAQAGLDTLFTKTSGHILHDWKSVLRASYHRGLYRLEVRPDEHDMSYALAASVQPSGSTIDINVLHRRIGHASHKRLKQMVRQGRFKGLDAVEGHFEFCEPCTLAKLKKLPFKPKSRRQTTAPFELIHTDLGGPITPQTPSGHRYWIVFIDDFTRFPWVYLLRTKDEALEKIKHFYEDVQGYFKKEMGEMRLSESFVQTMRSDGGGEYVGKRVQEYLRSKGILHETTAAHTPEQNGLAERMNQTLRDCSLAMLIDSGLPRKYWGEAMTTAAHLIARTPAAGLNGETPLEKMFGRSVDHTVMRPFGCPGYALVPKELRTGKFDEKARKCIMLGYQSGKKAYRLLDPANGKIFSSRHVVFDEQWKRNSLTTHSTALSPSITPNEPPADADWGQLLWHQRPLSTDEPQHHIKSLSSDTDDEDEKPCGRSDSQPLAPPPPAQGPVGAPDEHLENPQGPPPPPPAPAQVLRPPSQRERRPPQDTYAQKRKEHDNRLKERADRRKEESMARIQGRVHEAVGALGAEGRDLAGENQGNEEGLAILSLEDLAQEENSVYLVIENLTTGKSIPLTLAEALSGPDAPLWRGALEDEIHSFKENDVYDVVRIPKGVVPITSKPVLTHKLNEKGEIERYKVRIVARGFRQIKGVNFHETFSPVANLESIRIICSLAARFDLELDQMDVKTAYLNGVLDEEIYLSPPDGVDIEPGHCWKLKRSLYGLKQSGRTWNKTFDKALLEMGFQRLDAETCLYVYRDGKNVCFVVVYVDDLLLAASTRKFMDGIKERLQGRFKMKDLGEAKYILGIHIRRDRGKKEIYLSQENYIRSVLERTGMSDCKPSKTPLPANLKVTSVDPVDDTTLHTTNIDGVEVSYLSIVGSLMYAMLATRPDLAFAVGLLGRFSSAPKACHWALAKRCLRYLQHTRTMELKYDGKGQSVDVTFIGYVDAAWSDDVETSRSTGGYVFISSQGAVGWSSKRQPMVALSSTEAEYISMCYAGQHLAWLRTFFEDVGYPQKRPIELFNDNQGAIALSKDPQYRARTKHIQRKYHYVRDDLIRNQQAVVKYIPTGDMVADIMTKPLGLELHWKFVRAMGLQMDSSGSVMN